MPPCSPGSAEALTFPQVSPCYQVGDLCIQVEADLPISEHTFAPHLRQFRVNQPPGDVAVIRHHFSLPDTSSLGLANPIYRKVPWAIYALDHSYVYMGIPADPLSQKVHQVAVFSKDHCSGDIYHPNPDVFLRGHSTSLTLFPTDQILLGRLLADRQGCILHAAGMVLNGSGFLFAGHSGAGKSTITTQLRAEGQILCDDRNILRRWPDGWRVYGTWSHGDVPDVSPASAPLRAILLLEQAQENRLIPVQDRQEILHRLPFLLVKPLLTADWWVKTLDLLEQMAREVPVYRLKFDKSGDVIQVLKPLLDG